MSFETGSAKFPMKPRRNFPRSRAGCLTCRQRKKKCDEVKPECSGCVRNKLLCTWSEPTSLEPSNEVQTVRHNDRQTDDLEVLRGKPVADNALVVSGPDNAEHIAWCPVQRSFISLNRAAVLTPHSGTLLSHYIFGPAEDTALLSCLIPLAYVDDLVMHAIMAVSGSHLCQTQADRNREVELQAATESHFACVLRSVRAALHDLQPRDTDKVLRVLLVLLKMCSYEALSTITSTGGIFPHLRASRQLVLWLLEQDYQPKTPDSRFLLGYALETYSYLVLVNSVCPYGIMERRHVPHDSFLTSLESLSIYDTFGMRFAGCHELFNLIPAISQHAAARLREETIYPKRQTFYENTSSQIRSWQQAESQSASDTQCDTKRRAVGEMYRHAMLIFLQASHLGHSLPPPQVQGELQAHIGAIAVAIFENDLISSRFAIIMMWPMLVLGSVLVTQENRDGLALGLRASAYATWISIRVAELLETLWRDAEDDPRCWGPYGLYLTMERHRINLSLL